MYFFDTETCGLHGPIVTIQYCTLEEPGVIIHEVWYEPIKDTLKLIEDMIYDPEGIVGFNLAFDWFHICQLYTTLSLFGDKNILPVEAIDAYADYEQYGRSGPCLKPQTALDLFLYARRGPYQSTMARNDIVVKKVPTALAEPLRTELDKRVVLSDIYFAKKSDPKKRWQIMEIKDAFGSVIPDFRNLVLKFAPSSALKALTADVLGVKTDEIRRFKDIEVNSIYKPKEYGFAPFATAVGSPEKWNGAWPSVIMGHILHWRFNKAAREYAADDVRYTKSLWEYFDKPASGDLDSILACMVGAIRWKGYTLDIAKLKQLKSEAEEIMEIAKIHNFESPDVCRRYIEECLTETERQVLIHNDKISTRKMILESLLKWRVETVCSDCNGAGCEKCQDGLIKTDELPEVAKRARQILDYRHKSRLVNVLKKLIKAGRLHASFVVIGTKSTRMSGADGLNPQGIGKSSDLRGGFTLADSGLVLCGGDYGGFEVSIADAVYNDEALHEALSSGKKIHALFGLELFPHMTYDELLATDGLEEEKNLYGRAKNGVFAMFYGGDEGTLVRKVGVPLEVAQLAYRNFTTKYPGVGRARKKIFDSFCSMRQPGGLGTRIEWSEPADYIESMFGFKRYYTLENQICKTLFDLAEKPPKEWDQIKIKVIRRDRIQTATGALRSALFGCAFGIQSDNMRSAGNHVIQSTGAELTKKLQGRIWDIQPAGIFEWYVQPMNIHDEVLSPTHPSRTKTVAQCVEDFVIEHRKYVPLLKMDWKTGIKSWAEKK